MLDSVSKPQPNMAKSRTSPPQATTNKPIISTTNRTNASIPHKPISSVPTKPVTSTLIAFKLVDLINVIPRQ